MRIDNPEIIEGTEVINLTSPTGTVFPGSESVGELFFRTDQNILYVNINGLVGGWTDITTDNGVGTTNHIDNNAKNALTTATSSIPLAIGEDQVASGEQLIFDDESIQARMWTGAVWVADELFLNPDGGNVSAGGTLSTVGNITIPGIDTGTSDFEITNTINSGTIEFRVRDGVGTEGTGLLVTGGGAAALYFDDVSTFTTNADGAAVTTTGALTLASGTTAQRPTAANGMLRYNSDEDKLEGVETLSTTEWVSLQTARMGSVQTTNATPTSALAFAIPDNTAVLLRVKAIAFEPATGDTYWETADVAYKKVTGTGSVITAQNINTGGDGGTAAWGGLTYGVTTNNPDISVTGEAVHTIDWTVNAEVIAV